MRVGRLVDWDQLGPMQVPAQLSRPLKLEVVRPAAPHRLVCSSFCNNSSYFAQKACIIKNEQKLLSIRKEINL